MTCRVQPVGLWLAGQAGCGKSTLVADCIPPIIRRFGGDVKKILCMKSTTGQFYDKVTSETRIIVFDDFEGGKGSGEFLKLISRSASRDLNIKFGNVHVPNLSLIIVVNNLTPSEYIDKSNEIAHAQKRAATNRDAFLRRFTLFNLSDVVLSGLSLLHPHMPFKKAFAEAFHADFVKFVVRALRSELPEQIDSKEASEELINKTEDVLDSILL